MHRCDQQAALTAEQREGLTEELVDVLRQTEILLGFHELSTRSESEAASPAIRVDSSAWRHLAKAVRDAIAKAERLTQ